mgnify:CR=1 FL=1
MATIDAKDLDITTMYNITDDDAKRLVTNFIYHPPQGDQPERYGVIRSQAHDYAALIMGLCPPSRERSLALTKLEEVVMWANAAIARNEKRKINIKNTGD